MFWREQGRAKLMIASYIWLESFAFDFWFSVLYLSIFQSQLTFNMILCESQVDGLAVM